MPGSVRPVSDERDALLAYLAQQRHVLTLTAYGLTDEQALPGRRPASSAWAGSSNMSTRWSATGPTPSCSARTPSIPTPTGARNLPRPGRDRRRRHRPVRTGGGRDRGGHGRRRRSRPAGSGATGRPVVPRRRGGMVGTVGPPPPDHRDGPARRPRRHRPTVHRRGHGIPAHGRGRGVARRLRGSSGGSRLPTTKRRRRADFLSPVIAGWPWLDGEVADEITAWADLVRGCGVDLYGNRSCT